MAARISGSTNSSACTGEIGQGSAYETSTPASAPSVAGIPAFTRCGNVPLRPDFVLAESYHISRCPDPPRVLTGWAHVDRSVKCQIETRGWFGSPSSEALDHETIRRL